MSRPHFIILAARVSTVLVSLTANERKTATRDSCSLLLIGVSATPKHRFFLQILSGTNDAGGRTVRPYENLYQKSNYYAYDIPQDIQIL